MKKIGAVSQCHSTLKTQLENSLDPNQAKNEFQKIVNLYEECRKTAIDLYETANNTLQMLDTSIDEDCNTLKQEIYEITFNSDTQKEKIYHKATKEEIDRKLEECTKQLKAEKSHLLGELSTLWRLVKTNILNCNYEIFRLGFKDVVETKLISLITEEIDRLKNINIESLKAFCRKSRDMDDFEEKKGEYIKEAKIIYHDILKQYDELGITFLALRPLAGEINIKSIWGCDTELWDKVMNITLSYDTKTYETNAILSQNKNENPNLQVCKEKLKGEFQLQWQLARMYRAIFENELNIERDTKLKGYFKAWFFIPDNYVTNYVTILDK